jgi:polyferredoxin
LRGLKQWFSGRYLRFAALAQSLELRRFFTNWELTTKLFLVDFGTWHIALLTMASTGILWFAIFCGSSD